MHRFVVILAGVVGALGVMLGAYGAHGLEKSLVEQTLDSSEIADRLRQFDVAVRYHMIHALALLAIGYGAPRSKLIASAVVFFIAGLTFFCGGLYSMVLLGVMGHWAIVPAGGACFILAWILVASAGFVAAQRVDRVAG